MSKERGNFVVFEGGLGAGKSTVLAEFEEVLLDWKFFREPGGTEFGERVREAVQEDDSYFVDKYASLFAYTASRANLIRGVVIPEIKKGNNVAIDRYWYSTYAYQGTEGVSKPVIWAISLLATKSLKPDLVLHYDLAAEEGVRRKSKEKDKDRYDLKEVEFHKRVRRNYHQLKRLYPGIWRTIDASQSLEKVVGETKRIMQEFKLLKGE